MKKISLSAIAAILAVSAAFATSFSGEEYYLWNEESQAYDRSETPPSPEYIRSMCSGMQVDCFYSLDKTGKVKTVLYFKN